MRFTLVWFFIYVGSSCCSPQNLPESEVSEAKVTDEKIEKKSPVKKAMKKVVNKTPDKKGTKGNLITAEIVTKPFLKKNNKVTTRDEFYVRRSFQDYFIKFCESGVSREEVEKAIETGSMLNMEIEIKKGEWDKCGEEEVQSRTGNYIIIHKIN